MNRFLYLLIALVAAALTVGAQTAADHKQPAVDGVVESVGGQLRVGLTNTDSAREFRGTAQVSIDAPGRQSEVARFEFTLAPQESRLFPLDSQGTAGDHYTLSIHERAGTLALLKNAPINRGAEAPPVVMTPPAPSPPAPAATAKAGSGRRALRKTLPAPSPSAPATPVHAPPASTAQTAAKGLTVKARLAAGRPNPSPDPEIRTLAERLRQAQGRETNITLVPAPPATATEATAPEQPNEPQGDMIKKRSAKFARRGNSDEIKPIAAEQPTATPEGKFEAPIHDEVTSVVLVFDITTPSPIINGSLSVSAKGFKERQTITIKGAGSAEFKLPDEFNEPKINYTLTDASGKTLIAGEFDFEALKMEDSVRVSEVKFDRESYSPGQSASLVMTLEGRSSYGYVLEVTAKDENGSILLNESRRGIYSKGKSIQEFHLEIPAEAQGIVAVEFKALGNLTRKLFDSGSRNIIINDTQDDKEDSRLRIEDRR